MNVLLTAYVLVLALFAWFSLVKVVPDCATSRFRYRVWQLRDELVDEIRCGTYNDTERARRYVTALEWAIEEAADLSVLNLLFARVAAGRNRGRDMLDLSGLSSSDHSRLTRYRAEFESSVAAKALCGTPSGWVFFVLGMPVALVVVLAEGIRKGNTGPVMDRARRHVAHDFELRPIMTLMRSNGNGTREPLHQHTG